MEIREETDSRMCLRHRFMKSYKKNTLALFSCFVLSIILITSLLILVHTNHKMENIQGKMLFTDAAVRWKCWRPTRSWSGMR